MGIKGGWIVDCGLWICVPVSQIHFMTIEVSATGQESLRLLVADFFGTGTVVSVLKHLETAACDMLKKLVNTSAIWAAQHSLSAVVQAFHQGLLLCWSSPRRTLILGVVCVV